MWFHCHDLNHEVPKGYIFSRKRHTTMDFYIMDEIFPCCHTRSWNRRSHSPPPKLKSVWILRVMTPHMHKEDMKDLLFT